MQEVLPVSVVVLLASAQLRLEQVSAKLSSGEGNVVGRGALSRLSLLALLLLFFKVLQQLVLILLGELALVLSLQVLLRPVLTLLVVPLDVLVFPLPELVRPR